MLLQNPTQDAVIDPVRGVTKKEGHSPGHKIQMRTSEQVRGGGSSGSCAEGLYGDDLILVMCCS